MTIQHIKLMCLYVFFFTKCSTFSFISNVGLKLILEFSIISLSGVNLFQLSHSRSSESIPKHGYFKGDLFISLLETLVKKDFWYNESSHIGFFNHIVLVWIYQQDQSLTLILLIGLSRDNSSRRFNNNETQIQSTWNWHDF